MKIIVLFLSLIFLCSQNISIAQNTWSITHDYKDDSISNYTPLLLDCSGDHCTAVLRANADYVFLRSDDGGLSWQTQWTLPGPGNTPLGFRFVYAMQQIDSSNAIVVGDSGHIFRTFDAGKTWKKQTAADEYRISSLWGVHFHDPMNGIIGLGDRPMTTSDGGLHWTLGPLLGKPGDQNCHCFGPRQFSILSGNTKVYSTNNDWQTVDSTAPISDTSLHYPNLTRSVWSDDGIILAFGSAGGGTNVEAVIVRTSDGGKTWARVSIPVHAHSQNPSIISMSRITDDTLYAGGQFPGTILASSDKGITWTFDTVVIPKQLLTIQTETSIARPEPGVVLSSMIYTPSPSSPGIIARRSNTNMEVVDYHGTVTVYPYPNPSETSITFDLSDRRLSNIRVTDMLGREVMQAPMPPSGAITLDVSTLPNGIYYIHNGQERARFVKE